MRRLSISLAWEQTKACLASDGRLLAAVAAALFALPFAITEAVMPRGMTLDGTTSAWLFLLVFVVILVVMVGQLAVARLAIGPSVSVGDAIAHGVRRLPFYFFSTVLIGIGLMIAVLIAAIIIAGAGVPVAENEVPASPAFWLVVAVLVALYCFVWVRLVAMSTPVATAEAVGPIAIIRRSWEVTANQFWPLFGFGLFFFVGMSITVFAIGSVTGLVATLLFGPANPLSVSALIVALVDAVINAAFVALLTVMLARIYVQLSGRSSIDVTVPSSGT